MKFQGSLKKVQKFSKYSYFFNIGFIKNQLVLYNIIFTPSVREHSLLGKKIYAEWVWLQKNIQYFTVGSVEGRLLKNGVGSSSSGDIS